MTSRDESARADVSFGVLEARRMRRICVFCGSSPGSRPDYRAAAHLLGRELARRTIGLVYGGARVGTMGELARATLQAGGAVTGIIPRGLVHAEVAFTQLADLRIVDTMHERKATMFRLADGFIAMPGGLGTLEEFLEVLTWAQLGLHPKPCGLLNVCGYFDLFLEFLDRAVLERFVGPTTRALVLVDREPRALLERMDSYEAPRIDKAGWARELTAVAAPSGPARGGITFDPGEAG